MSKRIAKLLSLILTLTLFLSSCPPAGAAGDDPEISGYATISVEAFTIGGGYLVAPVSFPIHEGENAAQTLLRLLDQYGYTYHYTGRPEANFYLASLSGGRINYLPTNANVPEVLRGQIALHGGMNVNYSNRTAGSLGEFDYTSGSGWMYCINNAFPEVSFSDKVLNSGDVMRVQFTLAYGRDIGGSYSMGPDFPGSDYYPVPNKDELTVSIAEFLGENNYIPASALVEVSKLCEADEGMYYTPEQIHAIAVYHAGYTDVDQYTVGNEYVPLYDNSGAYFACAVPLLDASGAPAGHRNVGAIKNGLNFYLTDPFESNYTNIKTHADNGECVRYSPPFIYYLADPEAEQQYGYPPNSNVSVQSDTADAQEEIPFTANSDYFNDKNYQRNKTFLEWLELQNARSDPSLGSGELRRVHNRALMSWLTWKNSLGEAGEALSTSGENLSVGLACDLTSERYASISDGSRVYYGGNQSWFPSDFPFRRSTMTAKLFKNTGCGAVAFADSILYYIQKDYATYYKLLKHNNEPKYISDLTLNIPNPNYNNFNEWYTLSNGIMSRENYLNFLDFYSTMAEIPGESGTTIDALEKSFMALSNYTDYQSVKSYPIKNGVLAHDIETVENFLIEQLSDGVPVFFLNSNVDNKITQYLLNDPEQAAAVGLSKFQNFDNHWMTVTKFFRNVTFGDTHIAFATWGRRISINVELLQLNGTYYPYFYAYKIIPD